MSTSERCRGEAEKKKKGDLLSFTFLLEVPTSDEFKGREDGALLLKTGGVGGHGAWSNATDVSVMPPAGYKEYWATHASSKYLWREEGERGLR